MPLFAHTRTSACCSSDRCKIRGLGLGRCLSRCLRRCLGLSNVLPLRPCIQAYIRVSYVGCGASSHALAGVQTGSVKRDFCNIGKTFRFPKGSLTKGCLKTLILYLKYSIFEITNKPLILAFSHAWSASPLLTDTRLRSPFKLSPLRQASVAFDELA